MDEPLQVLISADMEGVAGIVHASETNPERYDYERGRRLVTAEVNAAIAGVFEAEPTAVVRVADAHGSYRNLLPEELDRRVTLIRGKPRAWGMLGGLTDKVDALLFIGYHGRAGSSPAVLAHTMTDALLDVRIDGRPMGEIGLNTLLAGSFGVPVVLLSGDDAAGAEFRDLVPEATVVEVKRSLGQTSAESLHPQEARERIQAATTIAIDGRDRVPVLRSTGPVTVEVELHGPSAVELAMLIPGIRRTAAARTITFPARDMAEAYRLVQLLVQISQLKPT
ncbi:M55 family metallopeptidase [Micromonospora sonneratiae]|uniref:M55 family metallopeptidase n=1 Tax=Micromonospora sonneratiae TaxID=1184706 RepID=A0ABW3Y7Q1_9ACTN